MRPTFYEPIIARASFKRHITPWRSAFKKESFPKAIRFGQKHECQAPSDEDEFAFEKDPWAFLSRGLVMVVSGGPVWASRGEGNTQEGAKSFGRKKQLVLDYETFTKTVLLSHYRTDGMSPPHESLFGFSFER